MLIYNPAYDIYHSIFRIYNIIHKIEFGTYIEIERVKIIDFHLVFPSTLSTIEFPQGFSKIKKSLLNLSFDYREVSNKYVTFHTMASLQNQAVDFLKNLGYIEIDALGKITKTQSFSDLKINILSNFYKDLSLSEEQKIIDFFYKTQLNGNNGLKKRTKLIEYRYN